MYNLWVFSKCLFYEGIFIMRIWHVNFRYYEETYSKIIPKKQSLSYSQGSSTLESNVISDWLNKWFSQLLEVVLRSTLDSSEEKDKKS